MCKVMYKYLAEWSGAGLQNLSRQFDSACYLEQKHIRPAGRASERKYWRRISYTGRKSVLGISARTGVFLMNKELLPPNDNPESLVSRCTCSRSALKAGDCF